MTTAVLLAALASGAAAMPGAAETLKMATDSGAKGSDAGNAIEAWAKEIETATNGELKVEIFYRNELGGQQEVFGLLMACSWPAMSI